MKKNHHDFTAKEWPFDGPPSQLAITTKFVMKKNSPILLVTHDTDGDWGFCCGTTRRKKDFLAVCMGCRCKTYPFLRDLWWLPRGWTAWRDSKQDQWRTERMLDED